VDLFKVIRSLYDEKKRLDRLIESLEQVHARGHVGRSGSPRKRRGRKQMTAEERREVSERMRKYWAARRAEAGKAEKIGQASAESECEPVLSGT
jgi:hypothetical protein